MLTMLSTIKDARSWMIVPDFSHGPPALDLVDEAA
jgi:hypothetical protein